jgi:SAM-dependent methyltransferase
VKNRAVSARFEGVAKIIRFNTRFYAASVVGVSSCCFFLAYLPPPRWLAMLVMAGATLILFWTLSSLAVSWYVYDHVGVTRWNWISSRFDRSPEKWANIHAGLDESTGALRRLLPGTDCVTIDIYDPALMTEPSIARARHLYPSAEPFQVGSAEALPLGDRDRDTVFLLFAAHELRDRETRTQLLREVSRILNDEGRIFLVEHPRDLANFAAFGPGFLHFHSVRNWLGCIREANLRVVRESRVTPFVRCFILGKGNA